MRKKRKNDDGQLFSKPPRRRVVEEFMPTASSPTIDDGLEIRARDRRHRSPIFTDPAFVDHGVESRRGRPIRR